VHSSDALLARFLALHPKIIDLSLTRIERLLQKLERPQDRLPPVIHVAGTNGKGSTIAFMRAMLEAAGLRVHVYTSPHLVRFHERIRIGQRGGGTFVDEAELVETLRHCEAINGGDAITVFEMTTAAALCLFAEHPADVLLLEVGLGGRFDATNVIKAPAACIVTAIGFDHKEYLGETIEKIAFEKAGIFKKNVPVVIAHQHYPEAEQELIAQATRKGSYPASVGGQDFHIHEENGRLVYEDQDRLLDLPLPKLGGRHQYHNAASAIAALRAAGFAEAGSSHIEQGLLSAVWPARLQRLTKGRLVDLAPTDAEIWLDGGHNPDGARVIADALAEREDNLQAPLILIVGMLGTKDTEGFLRPFSGLAQRLIAVPLIGQMAARPPEEVMHIARSVGIPADVSHSVEAALISLQDTRWAHPPRVLMCGSLFLAGDVLSANGTPPH
jgi:dihydrofolate synthase / folylpolyglutamate synthase